MMFRNTDVSNDQRCEGNRAGAHVGVTLCPRAQKSEVLLEPSLRNLHTSSHFVNLCIKKIDRPAEYLFHCFRMDLPNCDMTPCDTMSY